MTTQLDPGTTLAATDAMQQRETFTRDQVAYLVHLAYTSGLAHGHTFDLAELLATWAEHGADLPTRADRIAAEVTASGPERFGGGLPIPPTYFPRDPDYVSPRFPTLAEQSAWLTPADIAFCRGYHRENGGRA